MQCLLAMAAMNETLHKDEIRTHFHYALNLLEAILISYSHE